MKLGNIISSGRPMILIGIVILSYLSFPEYITENAEAMEYINDDRVSNVSKITHLDRMVLSVDISPSENMVAIGLNNGTVFIYNVTDLKVISILNPGYWIYDIEWCPVESKEFIAVAIGKNWDTNVGKVMVYSSSTWNLVEEMEYNTQIFSISWKSDGSLLAVPNVNEIDIYSTDDWTRIVAPIGNNYSWAVEWQPEGDLLAVGKMSFDPGYEGGSVDILDPSDDYSTLQKFGPYSYFPDVLKWTQEGNRLAITNLTLQIGDIGTPTVKFSYGYIGEMRITGWEWINDHDRFIVSNGTKIELYNVSYSTGKFQKDILFELPPGQPIRMMEISKDKGTLFACADNTLYIVSLSDLDLTRADEDLDEDGVINPDDAFPTDPAASKDLDDDGYPGEWNPGKTEEDSTTGLTLDEFPIDPAASVDSDDDGFPDDWNPGKTEADSTTGLTLDVFPDDPREWADSDSDTIGNNADMFPLDPAAWEDSDGDGFPDRWNPGKTENDSTTGLKIDAFPLDGSEWSDLDADGYGDNSDVFPLDPNEWADTDLDGFGNNGDAFPTDPAASVDTDHDGYPDQWNPGMDGEDSTTGLTIDHYPLDPMEHMKKADPEPSLTWLYAPIILITLLLILILAVIMIARSRKSSGQYLSPEEERIKRYRDDILLGLDEMEFDISDRELLDILSRKRRSGEISKENFDFIVEHVLSNR